jgi:hypothetical protein
VLNEAAAIGLWTAKRGHLWQLPAGTMTGRARVIGGCEGEDESVLFHSPFPHYLDLLPSFTAPLRRRSTRSFVGL